MLIVVDGIDGSGKTSLCRALATRLERAKTMKSLAGGAEYALMARTLTREIPEYVDILPRPLQDGVGEHYVHQFASRVALEIIPALRAGETIVCDRYWYSLVANQRQFGVDCSAFVPALLALPRPDTAILLDCPVDLAYRRTIERDGSRPGYSPLFLAGVASALNAMAAEVGLIRIDATTSAQVLVEKALCLIQQKGLSHASPHRG